VLFERSARTFDASPRMHPKMRPDPNSSGVARLDHPSPPCGAPVNAAAAATPGRLDPQSQAWLTQLRAERPVRDAAIRRLHGLLLKEARYEIRRRAAALAHPSGRDLEDLAMQAADDALLAILSKLDDFRGDARFTTWARRFAAIEVPGKIRRRLGRTRESPTDGDPSLADRAAHDDPQQLAELRELARTVGRLIADELTAHQREVLLAMAIDEVPANRLAVRLHSTPGALYKTLYDARAKLRAELVDHDVGDHPFPSRSGSEEPAISPPASAVGAPCGSFDE
jgi:RNA polymerase sigma-70 factor (ECF subfamily)